MRLINHRDATYQLLAARGSSLLEVRACSRRWLRGGREGGARIKGAREEEEKERI